MKHHRKLEKETKGAAAGGAASEASVLVVEIVS